MADLLYELQEYERIEEQLEAMKKKEEEYKEEIKRLEEENKKVKELFLELFRSKSDAWRFYLDVSLIQLETVMTPRGNAPCKLRGVLILDNLTTCCRRSTQTAQEAPKHNP